LPLISLNSLLNFSTANEKTSNQNAADLNADEYKVPVIVYEKRGQFIGLEANEIYDIATTTNEIKDPLKNSYGILGTIISENNIVTVVDVSTLVDKLVKPPKPNSGISQINNLESKIISSANENVTDQIPAKPDLSIPSGLRILFAEDTTFFVKRVKALLETHGAKVTHAPDGEEAWRVLTSKPTDFDLILTDIEMPNMNGFDLCTKIKSDQRFKSLPTVALTTRFRESDIEKGKSVGFNLYLEKLKSEELLHGINQVMTLRKVG
jgi:two-component system chemotaxis sensor kinase CheA